MHSRVEEKYCNKYEQSQTSSRHAGGHLIRKPASQLRIPGTIYNKGWAKDTAGRPRITKIMVFIATSQ
jgi:hypothetical protein